MLFNEPKLLKSIANDVLATGAEVSVLFNEPKLLKYMLRFYEQPYTYLRFSALQRAEIAEIRHDCRFYPIYDVVSVLFNEPKLLKWSLAMNIVISYPQVSVLFNEPKLLKSGGAMGARPPAIAFQCSSTSRNC